MTPQIMAFKGIYNLACLNSASFYSDLIFLYLLLYFTPPSSNYTACFFSMQRMLLILGLLQRLFPLPFNEAYTDY